MTRALTCAFAALLLSTTLPLCAWAEEDAGLAVGVEQLRHAAGTWQATTEFLRPDGSVGRQVEGTYRFDWVVPDRVLVGRSEIPELEQVSGLLFYVEPAKNLIGMSSVGADGHLWVMTGPIDSEVRTTPPTAMPDGTTMQLRFTRYNLEPDRFESKMEYSTDDGATWTQGNHQVFVRQSAVAADVGTLTWETLPAWLEAEAEAGFTGSVLVVRDGEVVVDRGYGLANRELGLANTPDTIFAIGSQPIDFTHAGILWLAQEGKLRLDEPITNYFDDVPADKRAITIEHLMSGASGLPDFHDIPSDRDPDHSWIDRDEAMRRIFAQELLFPPGEGDEHSHSAWGVLAAILEIASGQSYQDFTREHLFAPAGMADTGFNGDPVAEDRLAIGYGEKADGEINAPPYWGPVSWLVMGSGGQTSTTRDTGRWLDAMRQGKILEPEWARRFFGPGPGANRNGDNYGFEMFVYNGPMADSYAVTITNANNPQEAGGEDTPFVEVSRAIGDLILGPYRPKFSLGIQMDPGPEGTVEVTMVRPGSAAQRDGLQVGDLLLTAGGVPFGDDAMAVLQPYLTSGEAIDFVVRRGPEELAIRVQPNPR
jgi:CubicO group peptidase (beta-lactamase class C family)